MPNCYVKILIDGCEESIDVNWLSRVLRTSTLPGKERGVAYLLDGETKGVIDNDNIAIVRSHRPEIIGTKKFAKLCESLNEDADPFEGDKKTMEEWWEELRNA